MMLESQLIVYVTAAGSVGGTTLFSLFIDRIAGVAAIEDRSVWRFHLFSPAGSLGSSAPAPPRGTLMLGSRCLRAVSLSDS